MKKRFAYYERTNEPDGLETIGKVCTPCTRDRPPTISPTRGGLPARTSVQGGRPLRNSDACWRTASAGR